MHFEFATDQRILFGEGTLSEVGPAAKSLGERALVIHGGPVNRAQPLLDSLAEHQLTFITYQVDCEPTVDMIEQGVALAHQTDCSLVIGMGGGSALDTGKAIAALLTNPGQPLDYLEVIGQGKQIRNPPAPYIAIPTTSGTGSEVTRNAVLSSPEHGVKVSLRSLLMLPRLAIVDPQLTYSLPPEVTAATGLDALTQVLEPYVSSKANPLTDGFCLQGLAYAARSLYAAYLNGQDVIARREMSLASLYGGLALANAGLGAVHGFAGVLGGMFPAAHGALCARLLPFVMEANLQALRQRAPDHPALHRYTEIARLLTGNPQADAVDGVTWVRDLCIAMQIPPLSSYGLQPSDIPVVVPKTLASSSLKANPIPLTGDELSVILEQAL